MIKIKFSKKVFLVAGLVILSAGCVFTAIQLTTAAVPNPGHTASEIGGDDETERTFSGSSLDKYTFPGDLEIIKNLKMDSGILTVTNSAANGTVIGTNTNFNTIGTLGYISGVQGISNDVAYYSGAFTGGKGVYIDDILTLELRADAPSTPAEGMIYADTDHHLYYYNGTDWNQLD